MCLNDFCPRASKCLRFLDIQSEDQEYIDFTEICKEPYFLWFYDIDKEKKGEGMKLDNTTKYQDIIDDEELEKDCMELKSTVKSANTILVDKWREKYLQENYTNDTYTDTELIMVYKVFEFVKKKIEE